MGPGYPAYSFVGDNAVSCNGCHSETVQSWATTGHANAMASLVEGGTRTTRTACPATPPAGTPLSPSVTRC